MPGKEDRKKFPVPGVFIPPEMFLACQEIYARKRVDYYS